MKKTIYYSDPLHDDFALTHGRIRKKVIDAEYHYTHRSPVWHFASFVLYRLIVTPLAELLMRTVYGLRIRNRRALRRVRGGCFLYGNHTHGLADALLPSLLSFPRKAFVVTAPDAASIPLVGRLVELLGGMPLPCDIGGMKHMLAAMQRRVRRSAVTIYPEAHLWPYYNGIRPFPDASFRYPLLMHVPTVAFVVTYRQRRILRRLPPRITVTVSDPIAPESVASKKALRDCVYDFMCRAVAAQGSYAYIQYQSMEEKEA